jgi:hypothetical protein
VCSSSGGVEEIAGSNSTVVEEDTWDFSPTQLYDPPEMDFLKIRSAAEYDFSIDINVVAEKYLSILNDIMIKSRFY